MDLKNIEIIVSEIDGIITDGCAALEYLNHTLFKNYCVRDFDAINELKSYFTFVFLSSDPTISYNIMRKRNIPAYFTNNNSDKLTLLTKRILPKYNTRPENLLYIGSSFSDIPSMHLSQISMAPIASIGVASEALHQIPIGPGHGIISYVANILRVEIARRKCKE
jgi:3-deoxy-D-manno-octulosonate 8-phosphate phosphatase KdsC-like HAD superfamily phosphatase